MNKKILAYAVSVFAAAALLISCSQGKETHPVSEQCPGTIAGGRYLSTGGDFTVSASPKLWETKEDEESCLYMKKKENIWVSFSKTPGLTSEMVAEFETSFVERYMEGVRASYPDAKKVEQKVISDELVRIDITMSYGSGLYPMYQILYLATDGTNGYIITAILPEDEAKTAGAAVYEMVESIQFTSTTYKGEKDERT